MAKQKIIVTGGMGYLGSHTVVELFQQGFKPVIIDNLSNSELSVLKGIQNIIQQEVCFEKLDITNAIDFNECLDKHKDAEGIIHFAAFKAVGESVQNPFKYYSNNNNSLLNVLNGMKTYAISNLIFSSSCTVYGEPDVLPVLESTPIKKANSPYGFTKQIGEQMISDYVHAEASLNAISLRYFNPIGAHDSAEIGELPLGVPNNLLPYLTQTVIGKRQQLKVFGGDYNTPDGTAIRDYIHVVDLAKAHVRAINRLLENKNKSNHEFFNLGTGNGFSVLDVIRAFEKSTGKQVNYAVVDRREGDVQSIFANTDYANQELQWKAEKTLEDMTLSAWHWELKLQDKQR